MIKDEDIPADVWWVWGMQMTRQPIGLETLEKSEAIIKANPKYFPWETKYNSIPKQVHDAYYKELNEERDKEWADYVKDKEQKGESIGILPTLREMGELNQVKWTAKSLHEIFSDLAKRQEENRKKEEEKYKKDKALWDKHYKPYGLEYRK